VKLLVNDTDAGDFSTRNKSGVWAVVEALAGPTRVALKFHSDSSGQGRGLRGNYSISCVSDAACHYVGKCNPLRDPVTGKPRFETCKLKVRQ
jgi:hypothetical protein